jgi:hypothetical protein
MFDQHYLPSGRVEENAIMFGCHVAVETERHEDRKYTSQTLEYRIRITAI